MCCPYCRCKQTEVFKTLFRGSKTYRYRRCDFCRARFRTEERPVRWQGVDRKWPGTSPKRKGWESRRVSALKENCEVPTCGIDFKTPGLLNIA
jgi:hypothetical protein